MGKKLNLQIEELEERVAPLLLPAIQVSLGGAAWDGSLQLEEGDGTFTFELRDGKNELLFHKVETGSPLSLEFSLNKVLIGL